MNLKGLYNSLPFTTFPYFLLNVIQVVCFCFCWNMENFFCAFFFHNNSSHLRRIQNRRKKMMMNTNKMTLMKRRCNQSMDKFSYLALNRDCRICRMISRTFDLSQQFAEGLLQPLFGRPNILHLQTIYLNVKYWKHATRCSEIPGTSIYSQEFILPRI